jgi:hypothetical protein
VTHPLSDGDETALDDVLRALLFGHELDLVGNLRRFPLIVRYKLDRAHAAISLSQWQELSYRERRDLAILPADSEVDRRTYREVLSQVSQRHFGAAFQKATEDPDPSAYRAGAPLPLRLVEALNADGLGVPGESAWAALPELARFGLLKLSRPGHQNRRLAALVCDLFGGGQPHAASDKGSETST